MDTRLILEILLLVVLIGFSAFFSSAETAFTCVSRVRLRTLADAGNKRAALALRLLEKQSRFLSEILVGNNIVNLTASALTTVMVSRLGGSAWVSLGTGVLTLVVLVFGEVTPKTVATLRAERLVLRYVRFTALVTAILRPIAFIIRKLSDGVLWLLRVPKENNTASYTEEELRTIMDVSEEEGVIENEEKEFINNVFDFGDALVKDVMVPRAHITFIPADISYEELKSIYEEERYTRYPVYEEDADNVIGILNMKDLLFTGKEFALKDVIREPFFSYENRKTADLFREMRRESMPMAIILDEYGSVTGLITLEDLLEELVGEIRDEFDENELMSIQPVGEDEYLVEGAMKLDDLNDALSVDLNSEDYDSIGGLMIEQLDRLPEEGESVEVQGYVLTAEEVDRTHVETVRLKTPDSEEAEEE